MTRQVNINSKLFYSPKCPPRYTHYCNHCRYLGHLENFDIYICNDTILYRYGNEDSEYGSRNIGLSSPDYWTTFIASENRSDWHIFLLVLIRELYLNNIIKVEIYAK